jgi:hypothetical protein
MRTSIRRGFQVAVLTGTLIAVSASQTVAGGAEVIVGGESLDGVGHQVNICGWDATFTTTGQSHWTLVMAGDKHGHVTYQDEITDVLVFDDALSVPEALRGETWRGHNVFSFVANWDPSSSREMSRSVQRAFEGPFRNLSERITFRMAADGTLLVDRTITDWDPDCSALEG